MFRYSIFTPTLQTYIMRSRAGSSLPAFPGLLGTFALWALAFCWTERPCHTWAGFTLVSSDLRLSEPSWMCEPSCLTVFWQTCPCRLVKWLVPRYDLIWPTEVLTLPSILGLLTCFLLMLASGNFLTWLLYLHTHIYIYIIAIYVPACTYTDTYICTCICVYIYNIFYKNSFSL